MLAISYELQDVRSVRLQPDRGSVRQM